VTDDGWYADPTGRYVERLYLAGGWTRRVRAADGTETTEGEDHTGAVATAHAPAAARNWSPRSSPDWSTERPGIGLAIGVTGAVFAILGFVVLRWAADTSFADIRSLVGGDDSGFSVVTQMYTRVVYLPLLVVTIATGLFAAVGRTSARLVTGAAGLFGGVGLVAVVIWVETGAVGDDDSRRSALPVLVLMAVVGLASAVLGVGAVFDTRAVLARSLAATLAALAVVVHVYVVEDVFDGPSGPSFGAWACAIGYALLAVAPVVPYRRIDHA
jgi:hypothetical protein